jgi:UDP-N-acetylmuramoyl-tripeptide--D-alanyl-D-alanine ligase
VTVINDAYNANPEAMRAALATLRIIARGRRAFAVLGYMTDLGPDEVPLHEQLGRDAAGADLAGLIVVGDAAAPILAGAKSHPSWRGELLGVADTSAAIQAMRDRLRPGDAVLVKASRVAAIEGIALTLAGEKEPAR